MTRKRDIERPYTPALVSAETLAYLLDCSRSTVDDYVDKGYLPDPIEIGALKRWFWHDVEAFIRALNAPSSKPLANGASAAPPSEEEDPFLLGVKRVASSHA
jgi:predicted DNA-binding transcriptional regulator AlpA